MAKGVVVADKDTIIFDVIIVGAGAAGLMCALTAAHNGRSVLVLEKNKKPGSKILISGGGRCNFTNMDVSAANYISANLHFAKSALSRYTPWDFTDMMARHGLSWHEKTLGQLFCDQGAAAVLDMLLEEISAAGAQLLTDMDILQVSYVNQCFAVQCYNRSFRARSLVIASGGTSIPKMGATDFAFGIAKQFGIKLVEPAPALVPLTFEPALVGRMKGLAGVASECIVSCADQHFRENLLFTHRGLSGPAILQISSYWRAGEQITINLLPGVQNVSGWLKQLRSDRGRTALKTVLSEVLPDRLAQFVSEPWQGNLADLSNEALDHVQMALTCWSLTPTGTEGLKKAEVMRGGVSTDFLSSKTMEATSQPGLYFIGECVDVTGWLGGYNFQWAWASGHACGSAL